MAKKGHYLFAKLCESIMNEASTTIDAIKKVPGGTEIGKYMHKNLDIPHDADFRPTTDISLGRGGQYSGGRWYIVAGEKGAGALLYNNSSREYRVVLPRPANIPLDHDYGNGWTGDRGNEQFIDVTTGSGNGAKALMKKAIGKTVEIYTVGSGAGRALAQKKQQRQGYKQPSATDTLSYTNAEQFLLKKFKPTFLRTLKQAEAEYKGMLNIMLKGGSYKKMEEKIRWLQKLDGNIARLEAGTLTNDQMHEIFGAPIKQALMIAAQHYYPEETGGIDRHWGNYRMADQQGLFNLIDDISNGDTKKLSGVLSYFKNAILATKK